MDWTTNLLGSWRCFITFHILNNDTLCIATRGYSGVLHNRRVIDMPKQSKSFLDLSKNREDHSHEKKVNSLVQP